MEIIVYGSMYGTAKRYAEELSSRTGIIAEEYTCVGDIDRYGTIVYLGALYAGSVLGLKKTLNRIEDPLNRKIIIATVGLADPNDQGNRERIIEGIERQLSSDICDCASVYFLRGAIDYSNLKRRHRTMMAFAMRRAKRLNEKEKTAEIKAMLETYGKKISYINFDDLNPIIDEIKSLQ